MKYPILTIAMAIMLPLLSTAQTSEQAPNGPLTKPTSTPTRTTVKKKAITTKSQKTGMSGGSGGTTKGTGTGLHSTTSTGKPSMNGNGTTTQPPTVTQSDASSAIKQALINGITTGVNKVSVLDGYYGNPEIKIPLPAQLQPVDNALREIGAGQMVDKLVIQLNRSAEQAASQATPIFLSSINQLTITDAIHIISNQQQDAATAFLKRTTTEQLVAAFKPKIQVVLDQTKTNEVYGDVIGYYNKIPFVSPIEADLADYVTRKALDGLFIMVAKEEAKIRQNPGGQTSLVINTVFSNLLHKK